MSDLKNRLTIRNPRRTVIGLVIASVIVGAVLAFWGVSPGEFWRGIFDFFKSIFGWLGDSVAEIVVNLVIYLAIGASIVIPVWLIGRLLGGDKR